MTELKFTKQYGEYIELITGHNLGVSGLGDPKKIFELNDSEIIRFAFETAKYFAKCEFCNKKAKVIDSVYMAQIGAYCSLPVGGCVE